MKRKLYIHGIPISVTFSSRICSIQNDINLAYLLSRKIKEHTVLLADAVYQEFFNIYHRQLSIRKNSFMVEVWGHVYCDYYAQKLSKLLPTKWTNKLAKRISKYCAQVDIGEKPYDKNRFFWDAISWCKPLVQMLLPPIKSTKNNK